MAITHFQSMPEQPPIPSVVGGPGQHSLAYINLSAQQFAKRLNLPHSWILDNAKSECSDPIPCLSLGKSKRFRWDSPELVAWMDRHVVCPWHVDRSNGGLTVDYEYLDSAVFAGRLNISESWVRDQVRTRAIEVIPHVRFGKYVRFRWGSPELETWAERRMLFGNNRAVTRAQGTETIQ